MPEFVFGAQTYGKSQHKRCLNVPEEGTKYHNVVHVDAVMGRTMSGTRCGDAERLGPRQHTTGRSSFEVRHATAKLRQIIVAQQQKMHHVNAISE